MKKILTFAMATLVCMSCAAKKPVAQQQPVQQPTQTQVQPAGEDPEIAALKKQIELEKLQAELEKIRKQGTEINIPCVESSFDDEVYFRDLGVGTHEGNNPQACRYAAVDAAKGMIRKRLGEFVQGVSTFYTGNYSGTKDKNAVESKAATKLNGVVEKMLNDADKECEKQIVDHKGNINWYYVVRIPKQELKKNMIDALSQDEKDGIDFHEYQMQKFMDEKMEDMLKAKREAGY